MPRVIPLSYKTIVNFKDPTDIKLKRKPLFVRESAKEIIYTRKDEKVTVTDIDGNVEKLDWDKISTLEGCIKI